nr:hypothetical protein [Metallibacterium scheffleri]
MGSRRITIDSPCTPGSALTRVSHVLAADAQAQAPILRQAPLGDIHARDQLQPRRHRVIALARQAQPRIQHAVDAKAHRELVFLRLEMQIRGALFHRLRQHVVDQLHHRRFLGQFAQVRHIVAARAHAQRCVHA